MEVAAAAAATQNSCAREDGKKIANPRRAPSRDRAAGSIRRILAPVSYRESVPRIKRINPVATLPKKRIQVMNTSFRDGFQSVYGARVLTADFLPAVEAARDAGIHLLRGRRRRALSRRFISTATKTPSR
jgi:hypothetical protein